MLLNTLLAEAQLFFSWASLECSNVPQLSLIGPTSRSEIKPYESSPQCDVICSGVVQPLAHYFVFSYILIACYLAHNNLCHTGFTLRKFEFIMHRPFPPLAYSHLIQLRLILVDSSAKKVIFEANSPCLVFSRRAALNIDMTTFYSFSVSCS